MKTNLFYWIPINTWNLNEVFTTESISPIKFYDKRSFGNQNKKVQETIGIHDNLILYDEGIKSEVLLKISENLIDENCLEKIEKTNYYKYPKTIYLRKGYFFVYFSSSELKDNFISNSFMLLEIKTIKKYHKGTFIVDNNIFTENSQLSLQESLFLKEKNIQPYFDKAYNKIKGLIYGYLISRIFTFDKTEQALISRLSFIKNTIGGLHSEIILSKEYENQWLYNLITQVNSCKNIYINDIKNESIVFETLLMRLKEIDRLNKMRCDELIAQSSASYREDFNNHQNRLEKIKDEIFNLENEAGIVAFRKELRDIMDRERRNGEEGGKTRKYFKRGTFEYERKKELKQLINSFEYSSNYNQKKQEKEIIERTLENYHFGYTQYDTSIKEQFNRILEYINDLIREISKIIIDQKKHNNEFPNISFKININKLANYYQSKEKRYIDFEIDIPIELKKGLSDDEKNILIISLNSILSFSQGILGNFSEENILMILGEIGKKIPEGEAKEILSEYYKYRTFKNDSFKFPVDNNVISNLLVFLMKLQGHDQIKKMLINKGIKDKEIAFMFYGAYSGFASLPKTFTDIIFESNNDQLFEYLDDFLFDRYLNSNIGSC